MKLNRLNRGILLASAIFAGGYLPADADPVQLDPTSLEIGIAAGERHRETLTLSNDSPDETLNLTIALADWTLGADGELELAPPGEGRASAASWVRISPGFVSLAPGEERGILIDIMAPAGFERSDARRTAILASSIAPDTRPGRAGKMRKLDVASLVYLTGPHARSEPAIVDVRLASTQDEKSAIDLLVENTGSAHARLQGSVQVESNGKITQIPLASLVILGNTTRTFTLPLNAPPSTQARVEVDLVNMAATQRPDGRAALPRYTAPLGPSPSFR